MAGIMVLFRTIDTGKLIVEEELPLLGLQFAEITSSRSSAANIYFDLHAHARASNWGVRCGCSPSHINPSPRANPASFH